MASSEGDLLPVIPHYNTHQMWQMEAGLQGARSLPRHHMSTPKILAILRFTSMRGRVHRGGGGGGGGGGGDASLKGWSNTYSKELCMLEADL